MNEKGLFALMGMLAVAVCIAVSVLAQPVPIANVTAANGETIIFDTGPSLNPYPSIAGTHKGTITPAKTLNVSKVFTYPCEGTGGHSEYVAFYENGNEIANASWDGYQGDYHNIRFDVPLTLHKGVVYGYELRTGSYPQIIHNQTLTNDYGTINCTSFVDANGRSHDNWIPAIMLVGYFVVGDGVHNIDTHENFSTIQAAIDDSDTKDGHIIEVYAGSYVEHVNITKRLTLRGIGMPTVDANGSGSAITIGVDGCVVEGFIVTGGGSQGGNFLTGPDAGITVSSDGNTLVNNTASNNNYGIVLWHVSANTLTKNIAKANKYDGIYIDFSSNNYIIDNTASNNEVGIKIMRASNYNKITNNTISANKAWGIRQFVPELAPWLPSSSSYLTIANNNVSNNGNGTYLSRSSYNNITANIVYSNKGYGIRLFGSTSNKLRKNELYGNKYNFDVNCFGTSWNQDIDKTNTVNGKPIYYLIGKSGITLDESTNAGYVALISCNKITVKNLNLTNNGQGILLVETPNSILLNNTILNNEDGIHFHVSRDNIITNCNFSNNVHGIYLYNSMSTNITNNDISNCGKGIWAFIRSGNTTIYNNKIWNNKEEGIYLSCNYGNNVIGNNVSNNENGILCGSENSRIIGNVVTSNACNGIYLAGGCFNNVMCNTISLNGYGSVEGYGIKLRYNSHDRVYHNNLVKNSNQAYDSGYSNLWDTGPINGGNYWSDHECTGNPSDGGQPYDITGDAGAQDRYPFKDIWGWEKDES